LYAVMAEDRGPRSPARLSWRSACRTLSRSS